MGAQSDQLALAIIHCQGLQEIISAFNTETNEACLKAIVWTIEQLTAHSAHHVTFLNNSNVFARLLRLYLSTSTCPELKAQCLSALEVKRFCGSETRVKMHFLAEFIAQGIQMVG